MNPIIQYLTITLHLSKDVGNREICAWHFDVHDGNKEFEIFFKSVRAHIDLFMCTACKFNSG